MSLFSVITEIPPRLLSQLTSCRNFNLKYELSSYGELTPPLCVHTMFVGGSGDCLTMQVKFIVDPYSVGNLYKYFRSSFRYSSSLEEAIFFGSSLESSVNQVMRILEHTYEHFRTAHNNRYRFCQHNVKSQFWMLTMSLEGGEWGKIQAIKLSCTHTEVFSS